MSPTPRRPRRGAKAAEAEAPPRLDATAGLPMSGGGTHPSLGLGTFAMGRWERSHEARTRATIARALALGVRWFDSAETYGAGRSERVLGDVLAEHSGLTPPPFVVTKAWWENLRAGQVRASLLGSLRRLGLSSVALYLVHAPNPRIPVAETMGALADLQHEGKVGAVGVSNFDVGELEEARAALGNVDLAVDQVKYSILAPDEGEEVLGYCRDHRIVVEAYSPLAQGLLAGRYLDDDGPPTEIRRHDPALFGRDRLPDVLRRARGLRDLARTLDVPLPSLALHWLACRGVAPVFGASTPEQVEAVVRAWATRPTDEALEQADAVAGSVRA
ncbi:MAG TPA: aldo/keto reductase [Thermoplasmata archaeon]|nr:aldo/keto reductase [Thermoplasmata archaeon]